MKKLFAAKCSAVVTAIVVVATGCSSSKSSSSDSNSTGTASSTGTTKILYIPQSVGNAYFDPIGKGMQSRCSTLGCSVDIQGPSDSGATSQNPIIDAAIQKGYKVIAISANNVDAVTPSLRKAKNAGIVVLAVNSPIADGVANATINPTDFSTIGASMLKMMNDLLPSGGKIDVLSATENAPGQTAWIKQMKDAAGKGEFSKLSIGETQYGNDDAAKSTTVMSSMLGKGDKNILAPTAAGLPAAAKVLSGSPKKNSTVLSGLALPSSMKQYLSDGTVKKFGLWDVSAEGYAAAAVAMDIVKSGSKSLYASKTVTYTPPAGAATTASVSLTLDSTATTNASPFIVFTSQNIGQYNF